MADDKLDFQQIFQKVYDSTLQRLKVDASLSASIIPTPGLEVSIDAADDDIAIKDRSSGNLLKVNADGSINTTSSGGSTTVTGTVTANQGTAGVSAWKVDGSAVTQPISATSLPLPTSASTSALQSTGNTSLSSIDSKVPSGLTISSTRLLVDGSGVTQPVSGTVTANISTASSATCTNVGSSATNVTLLISNSSRKMGTFYNDSTSVAYLKFGTTASSTSYTIQMGPSSYFELPIPMYTGQIDCIWASANGNMRVTEY